MLSACLAGRSPSFCLCAKSETRDQLARKFVLVSSESGKEEFSNNIGDTRNQIGRAIDVLTGAEADVSQRTCLKEVEHVE